WAWWGSALSSWCWRGGASSAATSASWARAAGISRCACGSGLPERDPLSAFRRQGQTMDLALAFGMRCAGCSVRHLGNPTFASVRYPPYNARALLHLVTGGLSDRLGGDPMSEGKTPLRVAIVGTARRSAYMYGPILGALPDKVALVSVWGRSEGSARELGELLGVPWYTDLDKLVGETRPEIGIVSV